MTVLAKQAIVELLREQDFDKRLVITPLLDIDLQLTQNGIDLRLGSEFIVIRQTNLAKIDPADKQFFEQGVSRYQQRVKVPYGDKFTLHPGQLVLGCTLEYVGMPRETCGQILGRSSWGRLGLIIATANFIAAGFKGVITLEMVNLGQIPIEVRPGYRIAQLIVQKMSSGAEYDGKYACPTSVEFTKLHKDEDLAHWSDAERFRR